MPPANGALLSSIQKGTKLKKTTTNDRSAPKIGNVVSSSGSGGSGGNANAHSTGTTGTTANTGPPALGGLFAGGMPKLRSSSKNATGPLGAVETTTKPIASATLATKSPVVSAKSAEAPPPPPTKPPAKTKTAPPIPVKSPPLAPKPCAPLAKTFSRPEVPPPKPQSIKPTISKGTPPPVPDSIRKPSLSSSSASSTISKAAPPPPPPSRTRKQLQPPPPPPPKPSQSSITPAVVRPKQQQQHQHHVQTQFPIPKITAQKIQYPSGRSRATSFLPAKDLEPEEYLKNQVLLLEGELRDASEIENYSVCLSLKSAITSLKAAAAAASGEGSSCTLTIKEIHKIIN